MLPFSSPPPQGSRHIANFCQESVQLCRNKPGECVPSFLAISLGWTSKLGCHLGHKCQFVPPTTDKNSTLYRPSTPMVPLKFQKFIWRWPRNRFGPAWVAATDKILILAWGGMEGQRKLTKVAATGVLRGLVPRGHTENASSQSILKVRC